MTIRPVPSLTHDPEFETWAQLLRPASSKWELSELDASKSEVSIETLEIASRPHP